MFFFNYVILCFFFKKIWVFFLLSWRWWICWWRWWRYDEDVED